MFQCAEQPVISVDAKKKEQVGVFTNKGSEYQPKGQPEQVKIHDFPDPQLVKVLSTIPGMTDNLHPHKNRLAYYSRAVSGAEVRLARRYEDGAANETPIQEKD